MLKTILTTLIICSMALSCRTSKDNISETWGTQENRDATINYIKGTVVALFPEVEVSDPALQEFAVALQDGTSQQIESAQFVLMKYNEQRRSNPGAANTDIAGYIALHFLTMTNYVAIYKKEATELKYVGFTTAIKSAETGN